MTNADPCFYCGSSATHTCAGCGHRVCDSPICNGLATIEAAKRATRAVVAQSRRIANTLPKLPFNRRN